MWRWHEHMWGHGGAWMHGRSGVGFRHHAWMMGGSGTGGDSGWVPGEALMIALMVVLVVAVVVGVVLIARRRPPAPHAS